MTLPLPRLVSPLFGDSERLTFDQETDALTSLTRGLAGYLAGLRMVPDDRADAAFRQVLDHFAEPEELAAFPSAVVYPAGDGNYDQEGALAVVALDPSDPTGPALLKTTELDADLRVEVWATDPEERQRLVGMLEAAFWPSLELSGFVLELPHYCNARATFLAECVAYADEAGADKSRLRKASLNVRGRVAVYRVVPAGATGLLRPAIRSAVR